MLKNFWKRLLKFFFPAAGTPRWLRILPYAVLGVLTLILFVGAAYAWDYTNSPSFCGESCHTMPPEYTAYLTSPHARIDCVDCHIGKGFIATRITRKAGDAKHIFSLAFKNYEFPIRAHDLRPARETCELCHSPEKFADDSLREIKRYAEDRANSAYSNYLILKTGGGSKRAGLGRGIHWHIQNSVSFLASDPEEQEIPYVRVVEDDGSISEYVDLESGIDPTTIDPADLVEMDCITCHNRITHMVYSPRDTVDKLMASGLVSSDIPEIRRQAIEVYGSIFDTQDAGIKRIGSLDSFYETYYPDYYARNRQKVETAILALQEAYRSSVYPEQKSDWASHPSNVGHENSPGCFRCHDGKHLSTDGKGIRLECNLCHSIPVVSSANDFLTNIEISRGPEPESHLNSNWISVHHEVFDTTCTNCHTTGNPGGSDNTSFCSNSACHGSAWEYAGFDAPGLRELVLAQLPPAPTPIPLPEGGPLTFEATIGPLLAARCGSCHVQSTIQGFNLDSYANVMKGGTSGPAIIPGDPQNSLLVQKQSAPQPHFGQLNPQELELVVQWISAGAPEK